MARLSAVNGSTEESQEQGALVERKVQEEEDLIIELTPEGPSCQDRPILQKLRREFRKNRRLWRESRPDCYTYIFQRSCFCLPEFVEPIGVKVVNNEIVATKPEDATMPLSMDDLYRTLKDAINRCETGDAYQVDVTYGKGGIIEELSIDSIALAIDDEISYSTSDFKVCEA